MKGGCLGHAGFHQEVLELWLPMAITTLDFQIALGSTGYDLENEVLAIEDLHF